MAGAGLLGHVGIAKEVTWGTAVPATDFLKFISESFVHEIEQAAENEIRGLPAEPENYEGVNTFKGDLVLAARPVGLGFLLRSCMGAPTSGAGPPYTHVFLPVTTDFAAECALPPYTFEVHRNLASAFQFKGCVCNELTLEFGVKQKILKATASFLCKDTTTIAATAVTLEATAPFLWHQASITIAGVANTVLESFTLKMSNNLEAVENLNATKRVSRILRNGFFTCDMDAVISMIDLTEYNRFAAQSENALVIDLNPDASTELKIETNKWRYTAFPFNVGGPGRISCNCKGKAFYESVLGGAVKITLKNSKATY